MTPPDALSLLAALALRILASFLPFALVGLAGLLASLPLSRWAHRRRYRNRRQ